MNILFISHLSGKISAGPCWSVPARIKAQAVIDNVFWLNWGSAELEHWRETGVFHKSTEFSVCNLQELPAPFNKPDFVIFEGFYSINSTKLARQLEKIGVPYIVNPRGSLTRQALNNGSKWKKKVGHYLYFDRFVNRAASIQFLTKQEYEDSVSSCPKFFILSNGFNTPKVIKTSFSADSIKAVFIGRIDIYHKGLDILVNACALIAEELRKAKVKLDIYGPLNPDAEKLKVMLNEKGLDDMFELKGEISGKAKEQVLLDADAFVLTSRFEGHPMGLIEALAYGLPALVTVGSNMKDEIETANAGWACETSVESVRDGLLKMIEDKDSLKQKSVNAINLAKEYDWKALAEKLHNELKRL